MWTNATLEKLVVGAKVRDVGGWDSDDDMSLPPRCEGEVMWVGRRSFFLHLVEVDYQVGKQVVTHSYNAEAPEDMELLEVWEEEASNA